MIADTSFLIDLLRKEKEAILKAEELEEKNRSYSLGSPTVYELWLGIARSDVDNKKEILDIVESQVTHSLDQEAGLEAGKLQQKLIKDGDRIGHIDALIAGIAKKNTGKILTSNVQEFQRVNGLEVESYD